MSVAPPSMRYSERTLLARGPCCDALIGGSPRLTRHGDRCAFREDTCRSPLQGAFERRGKPALLTWEARPFTT